MTATNLVLHQLSELKYFDSEYIIDSDIKKLEIYELHEKCRFEIIYPIMLTEQKMLVTIGLRVIQSMKSTVDVTGKFALKNDLFATENDQKGSNRVDYPYRLLMWITYVVKNTRTLILL